MTNKQYVISCTCNWSGPLLPTDLYTFVDKSADYEITPRTDAQDYLFYTRLYVVALYKLEKGLLK